MNKHQNIESTEIVETDAAVITPSEQILAPLTLEDYSQFLYNTNYGGQPGQDFTAEGSKRSDFRMESAQMKSESNLSHPRKTLLYSTAPLQIRTVTHQSVS